MTFKTHDWFKSDIGEDGIMYDHALAFLEAGGVLSWSDWARLDADSRCVFRGAAEALAARRAAQAGLASQSREDAARTMTQDDGGASLVRLKLVQAADMAESRLK